MLEMAAQTERIGRLTRTQKAILIARRSLRFLRAVSRLILLTLKTLVLVWPASLPATVILFLFVVPGVLSHQTNEVLQKYVDADDSSSIKWFPLFLSAILAAFYGSLLADIVRRFTLHYANHWTRTLSILVYSIPSMSMAFAFYKLQSTNSNFYPFGLMALFVTGTFPMVLVLVRILKRHISKRQENLGTRVLLILLFLLILLLGLGENAPGNLESYVIRSAWLVGSVNIVLLFLFYFSYIAAYLKSLSKKLKVPILPLTVFAALTFSYFNLNDNHPVRLVPAPDNEWLWMQQAPWMKSRPDLNVERNYHILLISAEGGGIRAAYFAALTLARMADRCPRVLAHIFAISGVSGGALGATLFAASVAARPPDVRSERCDMRQKAQPVYENAVRNIFDKDHLAPLLAKMLFNDVLQQIIPFAIPSFDRQLGLELSFEESFSIEHKSGVLREPLRSFRYSLSNVSVPYLFINTTEVESGRRVAISPLTLGDFDLQADWHARKSPTLISAAGLSARFPFFSPAGYVEHGPFTYRYVDGGYVDNSGAATLRDIAFILSRNRKENAPFILRSLHIGSSPACYQNPKTEGDDCTATYHAPSAGGFGEFISPVSAVINARDAQVAYNLATLKAFLNPSIGTRFFDKVQMYNRGINIPLGWALSKQTANEIASQLDEGSEECVDVQTNSNGCELYWLVETIVNEKKHYD